ncbi:hypothetical protein GWK47_029601 [Chionoecetes opilio]|uniref:Uncharacterized protein n=1 Tax=Chionoecetes opilio TaxID=41210 RepID=A0A8J4YKA3_CHIOP|nr:hypothetical protein GWK47_029601 [Chionoecetes opilio]
MGEVSHKPGGLPFHREGSGPHPWKFTQDPLKVPCGVVYAATPTFVPHLPREETERVDAPKNRQLGDITAGENGAIKFAARNPGHGYITFEGGPQGTRGEAKFGGRYPLPSKNSLNILGVEVDSRSAFSAMETLRVSLPEGDSYAQ